MVAKHRKAHPQKISTWSTIHIVGMKQHMCCLWNSPSELVGVCCFYFFLSCWLYVVLTLIDAFCLKSQSVHWGHILHKTSFDLHPPIFLCSHIGYSIAAQGVNKMKTEFQVADDFRNFLLSFITVFPQFKGLFCFAVVLICVFVGYEWNLVMNCCSSVV